ncbi:MAG: hypothetical protein K0Q59_2143 [Paenibacillus sp.]|jgi:hypothetical protein|nr:hypothetical protein [Paenibacillus sp.]
MNKFTMLVLVTGSLFLWGSYYVENAASGRPALDTEVMSVVPPATEPTEVSFGLPVAAPSPELAESKPPYGLQQVEGISLYDDQAAVIELFGAPQAIERDPYTQDLEIYQYSGVDVGFCLGEVHFVRVWAETGSIDIDNNTIPMTLEAFTQELGKPDFIAEDGFVFRRQQAVIKLFIDAETQSLTFIDYFHSTNV